MEVGCDGAVARPSVRPRSFTRVGERAEVLKLQHGDDDDDTRKRWKLSPVYRLTSALISSLHPAESSVSAF